MALLFPLLPLDVDLKWEWEQRQVGVVGVEQVGVGVLAEGAGLALGAWPRRG